MKLQKLIFGPPDYFAYHRWLNAHYVFSGSIGGAALLIYLTEVLARFLFR